MFAKLLVSAKNPWIATENATALKAPRKLIKMKIVYIPLERATPSGSSFEGGVYVIPPAMHMPIAAIHRRINTIEIILITFLIYPNPLHLLMIIINKWKWGVKFICPHAGKNPIDKPTKLY